MDIAGRKLMMVTKRVIHKEKKESQQRSRVLFEWVDLYSKWPPKTQMVPKMNRKWSSTVNDPEKSRRKRKSEQNVKQWVEVKNNYK